MTPMMRRNAAWLPSVFNDLFDTDFMPKANATAPAINVKETDKAYTVELAAPGMTKEDFNVHINDEGNLIIKMEKKSCETDNKDEDKSARYLRREFSYTKFEQTLILPDDVKKEDIAARVENGVLTVKLPKLIEEKVKVSRQIEIG
jgi:HSP20 family protein